MKLKHILGIAFIVLSGGCIAYIFLKKTDVQMPENNICNPDHDKDEEVTIKEQKCDATMHRVNENMSQRNEMAKDVLTDIHADMKRSEEKINEKKTEIEMMMDNLKK